jgi:hypothetical protein
MKRSIVSTIAIALSASVVQAAGYVASAPAYGGPSQAVAICYYSTTYNVDFTSSIILKEPGNAVAESSDNCSGVLHGGGRCRTVANIGNSTAHWCEAFVDKPGRVRGRLELRNSSGAVLTSESAR